MCEQSSSKVKCTRWFHYHLQTARCHWNSSLQIWFEAAERTWSLHPEFAVVERLQFDSCRRFSKTLRASHFFHFFHSFVGEGIARSTSETVIFTCAQCTTTSSAYLATAWGWQIWNIHKSPNSWEKTCHQTPGVIALTLMVTKQLHQAPLAVPILRCYKTWALKVWTSKHFLWKIEVWYKK